MSDMPVAEKQKIKLDPAFLTKLTAILLGICAVVALLLGVVNSVTEPIITQMKQEKTNQAMAQVLKADSYNPVETKVEGVVAIHEAVSGGQKAGYVVEVAPNGFGGAINMVVGVDANGVVTGIAITKQAETPNVGTKVTGDQSVLDRFIGMSHANGDITVNAGANRFDAVSGATVSSKAVTAGVNAALAAVADVA